MIGTLFGNKIVYNIFCQVFANGSRKESESTVDTELAAVENNDMIDKAVSAKQINNALLYN